MIIFRLSVIVLMLLFGSGCVHVDAREYLSANSINIEKTSGFCDPPYSEMLVIGAKNKSTLTFPSFKIEVCSKYHTSKTVMSGILIPFFPYSLIQYLPRARSTMSHKRWIRIKNINELQSITLDSYSSFSGGKLIKPGEFIWIQVPEKDIIEVGIIDHLNNYNKFTLSTKKGYCIWSLTV